MTRVKRRRSCQEQAQAPAPGSERLMAKYGRNEWEVVEITSVESNDHKRLAASRREAGFACARPCAKKQR